MYKESLVKKTGLLFMLEAFFLYYVVNIQYETNSSCFIDHLEIIAGVMSGKATMIDL